MYHDVLISKNYLYYLVFTGPETALGRKHHDLVYLKSTIDLCLVLVVVGVLWWIDIVNIRIGPYLHDKFG